MRKLFNFIKRLATAAKSAKKAYKYGGYSTYNIAQINYGEILNKKNILITGGSSGIGLSIAKKCIAEGANVLITGKNLEKLQYAEKEIANPNLKIIIWDITQTTVIEDKLKEAQTTLNGEIDILVNNAGISDSTEFTNVTEEIWDKIYATNSKGVYFLTQALCKQWINKEKKSEKKVINISSQGGFVGATYPYRMTKWDIAGLTQGLGIKLAPHGIIINGIAPGIIATEMQAGLLNMKENIYSPMNPIKRYALPEEIAELALFLMSNASNFIVGQTIVCDGGYSLK